MTSPQDRDPAQPANASDRAARIILVADDYGQSAAISDGIADLAGSRRISAASAIVTLPRWTDDGQRLAALRDRIAIGLHVNLTLGRPLGRMPLTAPSGTLPSAGELIRMLLHARLAADRRAREIQGEIERQISAFEQATGFPPDFVDGHQHAHALPIVRRAFIAALQSRFSTAARRPLVRIPSEGIGVIVARGHAVAKSATIALLAAGFRRAVAAAGFPTNDGFAGVSDFRTSPDVFAAELRATRRRARGLHLVMCHPGQAEPEAGRSPATDNDLRADPIASRRPSELVVLAADNALTNLLWHPRRPADGPVIDWSSARRPAQ